ncbi:MULTISPECIES: linear amide C-N hydrolase [unclassified Acinetobacter]|uniref:linear amide C-N hydrolase n=1 Tax=unclassified Acinetobacter TaxID=196816 RepID=UPI0029351B99|nr:MULTISPECIES: linear amide C-N hydrolase [unclassified Acinetobacter]WOE33235.1 linear amide C-N hydrolase [Acinetobacter sp. SAAs470]WOE36984.1 linear amide C-N hydrolase [Acinetobacter sp. SAAs474]
MTVSSHLSFACTSLRIFDLHGNVYHGRTLEFPESPLITNFTYFPQGHLFQHLAPDDSLGLSYSAKYPIMALTMPKNQHELHDCLEGVNAAGLSFSLNMYHHQGLKSLDPAQYSHSIPYEALGEWGLANFATIEELRIGLDQVNVWSGIIDILGLNSPFHFVFYDKTGTSIVIEIKDGELIVYNNPTGVMTNGPEFPWHLTNLHNYTQLSNIDVPSSTIGGICLTQPDSGIATQNIPASNTSVGRFVKAFYYASFANKVADPHEQLVELSHIMNNFDRPKNSSLVHTVQDGKPLIAREYTVWTALTDLSRGLLYVREYSQLNYQKYAFSDFEQQQQLYSVAINQPSI